MAQNTSFNNIRKLPVETAVLTSLCREFVFVDEEFSNHPTVKEHNNDAMFWIELANQIHPMIEGHIATEVMAHKMQNVTVLDYLLSEIYNNIHQKSLLNDILIQAIANYLDAPQYDD